MGTTDGAMREAANPSETRAHRHRLAGHAPEREGGAAGHPPNPGKEGEAEEARPPHLASDNHLLWLWPCSGSYSLLSSSEDNWGYFCFLVRWDREGEGTSGKGAALDRDGHCA